MIAHALRLLAAAALLLASTVAYAQKEQRVALVIGNSAYQNAPLYNPGFDAEDMSKALQELGFKVIVRRNVDRNAMRAALRDFGEELKRAQVGLFYYSGHGVQLKGNNYLVPVKEDIRTEADAEDLAVPAAYVLGVMEESAARTKIMILDACRDNPYMRTFRSAGRGLAQMSPAAGTLIAFSTSAGSVADDGTGRNGLYTRHLLDSLRQPDSEVLRVFQRTRSGVVTESKGRQTPVEFNTLVGDFRFRIEVTVTGTAPVTVTVPDPGADDRALWDTVRDSRNPDELRAYLDRFPEGLFAGVARTRLKTLAAAATPVEQVAAIAPSTQGARERAGLFDGRWEGQSDVWHISAVVENGRIKGVVRCFRSLADKKWSAWGPTFDVMLPADGRMDTRLTPQSGWAERRVAGSFPNLSVAAQTEEKLQCPNGQVSLRRSQ